MHVLDQGHPHSCASASWSVNRSYSPTVYNSVKKDKKIVLGFFMSLNTQVHTELATNHQLNIVSMQIPRYVSTTVTLYSIWSHADTVEVENIMAPPFPEEVTIPIIRSTDKDTQKGYRVDITEGGLSPSPTCANPSVSIYFLSPLWISRTGGSGMYGVCVVCVADHFPLKCR